MDIQTLTGHNKVFLWLTNLLHQLLIFAAETNYEKVYGDFNTLK
jgi:hypothetical protein